MAFSLHLLFYVYLPIKSTAKTRNARLTVKFEIRMGIRMGILYIALKAFSDRLYTALLRSLEEFMFFWNLGVCHAHHVLFGVRYLGNSAS